MKPSSWKDFKDSGLLWWINTILHTFGWAIVLEESERGAYSAYPARVPFRGFSEEANTEGYQKVSTYLKDNIKDIEHEAKN